MAALPATSQAAQLRVAVAANFKPALDELIKKYQQKTGQRVLVSSASSGVLFNQIAHGAPFDVFLSADNERPQALEQRRLIVPGSRQPYAYGRLVLWHQPRSKNDKHRQTMTLDDLGRWQKRLAMANPAT
ncbi:MAG: molybdate ABC transporter substrate-binding protein, partial [Endozoicomonas sp.]